MSEELPDTAGAVSAYLNPNQDQPGRAAKASMMVAADANPDFEAELRRASAKTGVPLDAARVFPDDVKRQAAVEAHDYEAMSKQFPSTTKFLADPDNARLSHDDVANLSSTEATIGPIRGPKPTFLSYAGGLLKSLPQGAEMARQGVRMQLADLFGFDATLADAKQKYGQADLERRLTTPEFESSTASGVYSGLTSTVRAVPGLVASIATRSPTPLLATIGAQTETEAYGKYRNRGATAGEALVGGMAEGAIEVGTEMLPMSFLVNNLGKAGAGKFITGLLARELPGEQLATLAQDAVDTAIANPDKTWAQYAQERPSAAYQTLLATLTQAGVMEGAHVAMGRVQGNSQAAQHAAAVGEALTQFSDLAAASKVRERDTGTAQAFFQSLMQDGRDTVWITPQALAESGVIDQVAEALPGVAAQLEQAAVTGAEIRIPVADMMATLAGPEVAGKLIPHLSDEPGGFTQTTANEYMQSGAAKELAEEVARTLGAKQQDDAFTASKDAVAAGVLEQLNAAGRFAPQVNEAYAGMVGNFFAVQAARLGITPEEMAAKYPLQIKAEAMPGARTLDQGAMTMAGAAEKRFDQTLTEALYFLRSHGREVKLEGLNPAERLTAIDHEFGTGREYSPAQQEQGRAIWNRLKDAHERLFNIENPDARKGPDLVNVKPPADVATWDSSTKSYWDKQWPKFKKVAREGRVTAADLAKVEKLMMHPASASFGLADLVKEIKKRPAPAANQELYQSARTIEVDGVRRPIENSAGRPLAQTFAGQIAFWKFFGDSKIVDDKGRPLVAYHGTGDDIAQFDANKGEKYDGGWLGNGFYFTSSVDVAEDYADFKDGNAAANIIPAYLSVKNPYQATTRDKERLMLADKRGNAAKIKEWTDNLKAQGYDGVVLDYKRAGMTNGPLEIVAFAPEQIKSATGNDGTFDANDPSIVSQGERGSLSFGEDITAQPSIISLFAGADLSTFLHESGHFFLEVLNDVANRADAPAEIRADMDAILAWFGVPDLATWNALDLEGKRESHEKFARGFESYLFEGKAPTAELQGLFSRFRSWLVNVYRSLSALNVELTPEVRGVFDRMLASSEAIAMAERDAGFAGMFGTRPEFMTDDEWTAYRALTVKASTDAAHELETRSLRDMQWLGNAKAKVLRDMQREHNFRRAQIHNEVRKEVMAEPVYQAWQFLTLRGSESTRAWPTPEFKLDPKMLDTRVDNLYKAIAKLGGLNRDEVKSKWGVDHKEMPDSGVFGKPILRKGGGLSIDRMAEKLVEEHYLDAHDLAEFEEKFDRQRGGQEQYSWEHDWSQGERAPAEPLGDSNYHGKLHTPMLRHMFGEKSDTVQQLIKARMTSTDGGLDPDIVAEMIPGFDSGREMIDAILAVPTPSKMINDLVDQRMLERFGDMKDQAAIDRAIDEALHQKAHAKFVATELAALRKAAGKPAVLAKAAQQYAAQMVDRTPIKELRPHLFTAAAKRAGQAADKAFGKGDIQEAAAQKQIQLINTYAAQAAIAARETVDKAMTRFKTMTNGNNETVAKTRDLDMVMATRAILAEFGIGTRGEAASTYLAAVEKYDPAMATVLRASIEASTSNAKPVNELTISELGALRDEVESLWFLAKRSRQMEVDGDMLDRADVQDQLAARLEEIGVPDTVPGDEHAITPGEVNLSKFQTLRAAIRRVEAWAGAKDGTDEMGPFRRFIWNTIKDRADAYRADKAQYLKAYRDLLTPIAPTLDQVKIAAPELKYTFGFDKGGMGKVELLHALLHTGNAGNKKKLLLGRKWADETPDGGMDTGRWDAFITRMIKEGTLTKADFDFAQGVWDLMEAMKPAAQKAHREVFGRYFDEVTATPFMTPFGEYAGGYVPAIADSRIVSDAKTRAILEEETSTLMNVMPSTSKGFTKGRVEYNRPLLLDLRLLAQHIDKVLLFTHMEQPVRDVRRILGSDTVAARMHRVDPAAYDGLLTPWLNRAARQQVETPVSGDGGTMRFFSVVRSRAGMAAMFANVSNTAQQITGFSIAALRVKPSHLMGAAVDFIREPAASTAAVAAASPYMANRMENEVGAMTDAINDILLNPGIYQKATAWGAKHTYFLQSAVDNVMGPIIWQGAYNQAMETAPAHLSESELELYARRLADSAVRETQGSTLPEDISRIETGNAFVRLFTQFAGYFNMQANILGTEFARIPQEMGLRKGLGRGFYIMMFGFFAPAWVAQAIALAFRGGPDDEDKNGGYLDDWVAQVFGWGTLRAGTAMVPVVGQTINTLANTFNHKPYDDKMSTGPAISMIESAVSVPSDVYKLATGAGSATKTVRDVATLVTLATGFPASGAARPLVYATEVASGKAKPTGPVDVARGIITGTASPASKGK